MSDALAKKWKCAYCTYENWPANKRCVLCRTPKAPQFIDDTAASVLQQDIYKMAPLVSGDSNRVGGRSDESTTTSTSSSSGGQLVVGPGSKWPCQVCTYLNWPKANKCTQCLTLRPKAVAVLNPSTTQPLSINVSISQSISTSSGPSSRRSSPRTSPNSPEAAKALNNDKNRAVAVASKSLKWNCKACTYENWPKAHRCVLCGVLRGRTYLEIGSSTESISSAAESDEPRNTLALSSSKRRSPPALSPSSRNAEGLDIQTLIGATASPNIYQEKHSQEQRQRSEEKKLRLIRKRLRDAEWLWLNACQGVVEGDINAVEAYLAGGGSATRQMTSEECMLLSRVSAFEAGYTLVHLAVRFQREDMLAVLLTASDVVSKAKKRVPSHVAPDVATDILREISSSLRQRKGDFPCYFLTEIATFALPADIEDLPNPIKKQLFDEVLDQDVQKELEEEEPVINWSVEITERLGSRLHALWNRTAGDCLLDSVLQASWGVMDRDNTLRRALAESLGEGANMFYPRWKETEMVHAQLLHFTLDETQWQQDWSILLSLATEPGSSLEQVHIFALAHILRRPIIVYGIKFVKSFRGENIGFARFQGVYLPLLWEQSFCWRTPIALGYTRGHFSALVPMEVDMYENVGAGANVHNNDDNQVAYLPLTDCEGKILPIHFLPPTELGREETILREWLDCCVTEGGLLVAQQKLSKPQLLVRQMLDEWLDRYRHLAEVVASASAVARTPRTTPTPSAPCPAAPTQGALSSDEETDDE